MSKRLPWQSRATATTKPAAAPPLTALYPLPQLPSGLGVEAAGVVEVVGSAVQDLQPGQRVAYATAGVGAYAERRAVAAERLVPLADGISDEITAAILLKGMTVEY